MINFQEKVLLDPMYEVPGSDIVNVIINDEVINGTKAAEYIHESPPTVSDNEYEENFEDEKISAQNP